MQPLTITLSHAASAFRLEIANASQSPVRIWSAEFSLGYDSVYFRVSAHDGRECFIRRKPAIWSANVPEFVSIQPGRNHALRIDVNDGTWVLKHCRIEPRTKIEIAAVLEIPDDEISKELAVTTGRYESNNLEFGSIDEIVNRDGGGANDG